jgi:UDP-N-acetylglucosamine 2-epimerase (non-hydrolysing)
MLVFLVAGARPNFMKIAPIYRASLAYSDVDCRIIHTGQHYDYQMSQAFFEDLEIPKPQYFLDAGSGSHAVQTAKIMVAFEEVCIKEKPDLVMVVGDVNSTLACSIVAKKLLINVAHVEAGLRSFDLTMPEEINRMVTDAITDDFFVTEESGSRNLLREGKLADRVHLVGHVMIDNLLHQFKKLEDEDVKTFSVFSLKPAKKSYAFMTLHRPSNVDDRDTFMGIAAALNEIAEEMPIIFPVHPRTKKMMEKFQINGDRYLFNSSILRGAGEKGTDNVAMPAKNGTDTHLPAVNRNQSLFSLPFSLGNQSPFSLSENIKLLSPLGFKESLFLWKDAKFVLTDSGGLQEETTALGVPCVTIRENTERPITVELGTNVLAGTSKAGILRAYSEALKKAKHATVPPLWDGRASERIWDVIIKKGRS